MGKIQEKIQELEDELRTTKYNKRTQHHIGLVKAKIASLKQEGEQKKKGTGATKGYFIKKSGDATVVLVGYPSVGKSTLLNRLTDADSKIGAYDFTTLDIIPGMLLYKHAKIQILDVPGIIRGAAKGAGRGREVLSMVRAADLVLIMVDVHHLSQFQTIQKELYKAGIRMNQERPRVTIKKTSKDGIRIGSTVPLGVEEETLQGILKVFKINNAIVNIRSRINEDQFIDCIENNRVYIPGLVVVNKIDEADDFRKAKEKFPMAIFISAIKGKNLAFLKERIFERLRLIRIFLKQPGHEPDLKEPLIMRERATIKNLCDHIHRDFASKFKFARIWGASAKYDGQMRTKLDYELKDGDIVELHMH